MSVIIKNIKVPTGDICIMQGDKGMLEFLSIADYGKDANIKADFLGIKRPINGVIATDTLPLTDKWVVTISTQYGCSMGCNFCDVPNVGKGKNATLKDLTDETITAILLHPEIHSTKRFNLHYARMGEPTFNFNVLEHAKHLHNIVKPFIGNSLIHPVISTMMPVKNKKLTEFLQNWCDIKNYNYRGCAGLQLSINSTCDKQRDIMFNRNSLKLHEISEIGKLLPMPVGRKYTLNFALDDKFEINASKLVELFNPEKFMCKITPIHNTDSSIKNNIQTMDGYTSYYSYQEAENNLINAGFDVIVFIPSKDEEESRITCGNAILSNFKMKNKKLHK